MDSVTFALIAIVFVAHLVVGLALARRFSSRQRGPGCGSTPPRRMPPPPVFRASADGGLATTAPRVSILSLFTNNGAATLMIYGPIGDLYWDGVSARDMVQQIDALDVDNINVRINSDGGVITEGTAIHNALKRHKARVTVTIDGIAASIASGIAMAGDVIEMPRNALMMIHAPWTWAAGNAQQLRETADTLDTHGRAIATMYAAKTGKPEADIQALFDDGKDHWYTASEAIGAGFADRLSGEQDVDTEGAASASLQSYLNALTKAPAAIAARLRSHLNAAAQPRTFASVPLAIQRSVVAEIEDPAMKTALLNVMANAAGAPSNPAAPTASNPAPAAPPATAAPTPPAGPNEADFLARINARNQSVRTIFAGFRDRAGMNELESACLADSSLTLEQIQGRVLAKLGEGSTPLNPPNGGGDPSVHASADDADKFRDAMVQSICARVTVRKDNKDVPVAQLDGANPFRGISLQGMCRQILIRADRANARNVHLLNGTALAQQVFGLHTTSDFPLLLSTSANKVLRAAYDAAPSTWQIWCQQGEVSDFKSSPRIMLGSFSSLAVVPEGQDIDFDGTMSEEAENIQARTMGRGIAMTRQMIINDDLGGFLNRSRALGFAARRTVNNDVYAALVANANMADGGALFNATAVTTAGGHANLTSSGTAISTASIAVGEGLMAAQKEPSLNDTLGLMPRYLIVPYGKKQIAWDVLNSPTDIGQTNSAKRNYAQSLGLELVAEHQLAGNAWYLAADQNQAPLMEVAFLNGNSTPQVDENVDFKSKSLLMTVILDYGVKSMEWRAGYKNNGA